MAYRQSWEVRKSRLLDLIFFVLTRKLTLSMFLSVKYKFHKVTLFFFLVSNLPEPVKW